MIEINMGSLRINLSSLINNVVENNDKILVKNKRGNFVIMSENEYDSMMETINLLSKKEMLDILKNGDSENIGDMMTYDSNEDWK